MGMKRKKNIHAVILGRLGGKAGTGTVKARTSEQARSAAMVRVKNMKNKAFTLVELLVVIAIIGILAAMVTPMFFSVKERAKEAKARVEVKALEVAFKSYLDTYKVWPNSGGGNLFSDGPIDDVILKALRGDRSPRANAQGIAFYEFHSSNDANDVWGNPYQVMFDNNYDNKIDNKPDVYRSIIVWSTGKDITDDKDDVCSWK